MARSTTLLIALVLVGVVAAAAAGVGPAALAADDAGTDGPTATDTDAGATDDDGTDGDDDTADGDLTAETNETAGDSDGDPAFDGTVDRIEDCGTTCRDVTATLSNVGDATATSVAVEFRLSVDGDRIRANEESVGTLAAGESYTTAQRIELGYGDALAIERNDGWVTIETVIRFDGGTVVTAEERQVA